MGERQYLCIDLKSFYASVECVERGLDPMTARLVVADPGRGEKTICLAVSPALKALGIRNRCRVYEIPATVSYLMAPPRMKRYMEYSADIYGVYLEYIAKEDIHVYSIDEAFLDVTDYLSLYHMTAWELGEKIRKNIREKLGIPAAAGVGTNLYLAKIALDILAKHAPDSMAYLDERLFREKLWDYRPLTDFWRIGKGTVKRLAGIGITTMGQLAHTEEEILYRMFGVDAELLIDHAWGRESVTMEDIKAYRAKSSYLSSGQVLMRDYDFEEGKLIVKEMLDALCLDLAEKGLAAQSVTLAVGYSYDLELKPASGTAALRGGGSSYRVLLSPVMELYGRIVERDKPIRRINVTLNGIGKKTYEQYDLFTDAAGAERDRKLQQAALEIKRRFGKNALVRGMDLQEAATARERNRQIGGHRSGEE